MKEIILDKINIAYDTKASKQCPIKLDEEIYLEDKELPKYLISSTSMSFYEFYHADNPILNDDDFQLNDMFKQIIQRFPHTNHNQIVYDEKDYNFKNIPVFIDFKDYLIGVINKDQYKEFNKVINQINSLEIVFIDDLHNLKGYKYKQLNLDGRFGKRQLLIDSHQDNCIKIQDKLEYYNEMYSFAYYSYAAMIRFFDEHEITSYEQFNEHYGKYIYSFTVTKNNLTIPLVWPDYLYHQPENHLEFGILSLSGQKRYQMFNDWNEGDELIIEILADGFEDVVFKTKLKKPMTVKPKLSKNEYSNDEEIHLTVEQEIIEEIKQSLATFEIIQPDKEILSYKHIKFSLNEDSIIIDTNQLKEIGRYQLKLISPTCGTLLVLFTIVKEG